MAKLPIYNSQGNISPEKMTYETGQTIKPIDEFSQSAIAMQRAGYILGELAEKWQDSKNQVETLDAKNKMFEQTSSILQEAANYSGYTNQKDIEEKKLEYQQRLQGITPELLNGFSSQRAAKNFQMQSQLATIQNSLKLDEIFRNKLIDDAKSNIVKSQKLNMENFIATGNAQFKNSYLNDLESMFQAGFIDEEYKTKMGLKTDEWDVYHVMRQAELDPDTTIKNLQAGKYNIKPEYYHDLLKDLTNIKSNAQLMREYEENVKQNHGEDEATKYIYGNTSYDDKLKYINEQEFLGNISEKFAQQARRNLKQFKPSNERSFSSAQSIDEVMHRAYDLNESDLSDEDYLKGIRNLRNDINIMFENGDITSKDAIKLNNQLNTATNKKVSEATNKIAGGYGAAKDYIDKMLPPEARAEAVREVFYATSDKDTSSMNKTQRDQLYYNSAIKAVEKISQQNRAKALQLTRPARIGDMWQGHQITSLYGLREKPLPNGSTNHKGIDLSYKNNENIGAFSGGKVIKVVNDQSKSDKGYGNYVDIQSYDGTIHRYAHANKITVKEGQEVKTGQTIAKAGSTGASTGTHLHYEKIVKGKSVNPMRNQETTKIASKGWSF